eukprot:CAMPEP_0174252670 /NCGR_PEP_ID=MMETSP0439-20130205/2038_1 /TAXON_ID=0 /ORGANISM="Stereomyxa ramosa, Strain Chinc5" /LENGTH=959 /DNA_ID=CAMNT_0015333239 /DNA_START=480 /DNA_END=3355 /DNA_ORIENTATION=+
MTAFDIGQKHHIHLYNPKATILQRESVCKVLRYSHYYVVNEHLPSVTKPILRNGDEGDVPSKEKLIKIAPVSLELLFDQTKFHDVELTCEEKTWNLHLVVLYFRAHGLYQLIVSQAEGKMKKQKGSADNEIICIGTSVLGFDTFSNAILEALLRFIYTDTFDVLKVAKDKANIQILYNCAHKFKIPSLVKVLCCINSGSTSDIGAGAVSTMATDWHEAIVKPNFFTDVVFSADTEEESVLDLTATICVHKVVLCARSSYFRAMFMGMLQEPGVSQIPITDVSLNIFSHVITFIYTGAVSKVKDSELLELMRAADIYDLEPLKIWCSRRISLAINAENCRDLLRISEMYHTKKLFKRCGEFLLRGCPTSRPPPWMLRRMSDFMRSSITGEKLNVKYLFRELYTSTVKTLEKEIVECDKLLKLADYDKVLDCWGKYDTYSVITRLICLVCPSERSLSSLFTQPEEFKQLTADLPYPLTDIHGNTFLHLLVSKRLTQMKEEKVESPENMEIENENDCFWMSQFFDRRNKHKELDNVINSKNVAGFTPLHLFVMSNGDDIQVFNWLLENGASMKEVDCYSNTVLHLMISYERFILIEWLISNKLDLFLELLSYLDGHNCSPTEYSFYNVPRFTIKHLAIIEKNDALTEILTSSFSDKKKIVPNAYGIVFGKSRVGFKDTMTPTPLHLLCARPNTDMELAAKLILENNPEHVFNFKQMISHFKKKEEKKSTKQSGDNLYYEGMDDETALQLAITASLLTFSETSDMDVVQEEEQVEEEKEHWTDIIQEVVNSEEYSLNTSNRQFFHFLADQSSVLGCTVYNAPMIALLAANYDLANMFLFQMMFDTDHKGMTVPLFKSKKVVMGKRSKKKKYSEFVLTLQGVAGAAVTTSRPKKKKRRSKRDAELSFYFTSPGLHVAAPGKKKTRFIIDDTYFSCETEELRDKCLLAVDFALTFLANNQNLLFV